MLFFSRPATTAILAIPLVVCLAAVPNLLPKSVFDSLPAWAQNKITLGWELQGGTRIQLRVDEDDMRKRVLLALQGDVHKVLREARVGFTRRPVIRNNGVEVPFHERDLQRGLATLSEFAQPFDEVAMVSDNDLVRLEPTDEWIKERIRQSRGAAVDFIAQRLTNWGVQHFSIEHRGSDRVLVEFPGEWNPLFAIHY
jgi:preprotein translocase subunit SecD